MKTKVNKNIIKVTQFHNGYEVRYNKSYINGEFISEGNGFHDENYNHLQYCEKDKIFDTWYKVKCSSCYISFIPTLSEAIEIDKKYNK